MLERIDIFWEGPLTLESSKELNGPTDYGLYQFYGNHIIYGQNALLYIGRAKDISFGARMGQHKLKDWTGSSGNIHIGRLCGESQPANDQHWSHLIEIAEKLLIYAHTPSWNSANINNFRDVGDIHIFNWGSPGQLLPEVTSKRWNVPNNLMPNGYEIFRKP